MGDIRQQVCWDQEKKEDLRHFQEPNCGYSLDQSSSKTAGLVGGSRCAVVRISQNCIKKGDLGNRQQVDGHPRLRGKAKPSDPTEQLMNKNMLALMERGQNTVCGAVQPQTSQSAHAGSCLKRPCEPQNLTMKRWRKMAWTDESHFLFLPVCITDLEKRWQELALWEGGRVVHYFDV